MTMLTKKQLTAKIAGISKRSTTLRDDVHVALCHAAGWAYEHGDVTAFTRLFAATSGMNRKALTAWVHDVGFALLQKDGSFKLNKTARKAADFEGGSAVVDFLLAEPKWYEREESAAAVVKALDVAARLEGVAKALTKALEDGKAIKFDTAAIKLAMQHNMRAVQKAERILAMQQPNTRDSDADEELYAIAAE